MPAPLDSQAKPRCKPGTTQAFQSQAHDRRRTSPQSPESGAAGGGAGEWVISGLISFDRPQNTNGRKRNPIQEQEIIADQKKQTAR
jgi:hypothetical protein